MLSCMHIHDREEFLELEKDTPSTELHALLGKIVVGMLSPDIGLSLHELIEALHRMSANADSEKTRLQCSQLIDNLMRKMH